MGTGAPGSAGQLSVADWARGAVSLGTYLCPLKQKTYIREAPECRAQHSGESVCMVWV